MDEEQFKKTISLLSSFKTRSEITLEEVPAPQKLAKFAYALSADVSNGLPGDDEDEIANGRFVILHEPGGQDSWDGEFRCVTYIDADLELSEANDPKLPDYGWNWLLRALDENGCHIASPSGTVTRSVSHSFGKLFTTFDGGKIEIRASWTALIAKPEDLVSHLEAWCNLLAEISYLQPIPEGVATFKR